MIATRPAYDDHPLAARWSKRERDLLISFPCAPDGHLLHGVLSTAFTAELTRRGYDITTLRFSVKRIKKATP